MELYVVFPSLISFLVCFLFGKQLGDKAVQFISCAALVISAVSAVTLFFTVAYGDADASYTTTLAPWIVSDVLSANWAIKVDTLSVMMMCVVTIVSACVHVYSVGYMSHDPCKARFMSYLSLFTFAMLMLVSADNMLQLFFGWEGVGLASYLLIGFWNEKPSANDASIKAFVANRVGDFGLALGVIATFFVFGSVEFDTIFSQVPQQASAIFSVFGSDYHALTVIALLLFVGAMGKSAQLGLHVWLPDAMEGPTPVSALIHAATMVTAGVFLVARMSPLYEYAPDALMVVTLVGAATAFVAATIALTQFDIKRVIAYSTMSQLGYMFFALGVSAYGAALFHLMTHAFFKALLFLGAGSVIHAVSDEQDMRRMGGLYKHIPYTYVMMWIGNLALAGVPFFAGYYSKDMILEATWADGSWYGYIAFWMGIVAAVLTAFYSWRLLFMVFHGEPRASKDVMSHVHESPAVMMIPLVVLTIGALFAGAFFYQDFVGSAAHHDVLHGAKTEHVAHGSGHEPSHSPVHNEAHDEGGDDGIWAKEDFWKESLVVKAENDTVEMGHSVPWWVKKMPIGCGVIGIFLAYLLYIRFTSVPAAVVSVCGGLHGFLFRKWYFDELYQCTIIKLNLALGDLFSWGDRQVIDKVGPDGFAFTTRRVSRILSIAQTGYVFHYAFVMMVTVIGLVTWFVIKG